MVLCLYFFWSIVYWHYIIGLSLLADWCIISHTVEVLKLKIVLKIWKWKLLPVVVRMTENKNLNEKITGSLDLLLFLYNIMNDMAFSYVITTQMNAEVTWFIVSLTDSFCERILNFKSIKCFRLFGSFYERMSYYCKN